MDYDWNEDQQAIREAVEALCERHAGAARAIELDAKSQWDEDLDAALAEAGFHAVALGAPDTGPLEAAMLRYFLTHEGRVISRDEFLTKVWGYERSPATRTVDFHVLRLRQKIEEDANTPRHIVTVHGVGYRFER